MLGSARASVDTQTAKSKSAPAPLASRHTTPTRANREHTAWTGNQSRLRHLPLQRKLTIGSTNDPLEAEADRTAERVMRMTVPGQTRSPAVSSTGRQAPLAAAVLRRCSCGGSCDKCRARQRNTTSSPDDFALQRKPSGPSSVDEAPASVHQTLRSSGSPLDLATRAFFEPRFGHDFKDVRVHTGAAAANSAREIDALAYTVGSNIVFGSQRFAPHTSHGQRLLAHELTHVVQQRSSQSVARHVRRAQLPSSGPAQNTQVPARGPVPQPDPSNGCYGESVNGPGRVKAVGANQWVLSNFDIDQHYLKKEHFDFLRDVVAPKINKTPAGKFKVNIVGEASTTADFAYNLSLSAARAKCVSQQLIAAGLDDDHRPNVVAQTGELRGDLEQLLHGIDPRIGIEDSRKRMVTIYLVPAGECTREARSRSSQNFFARIACRSQSEIRINIGVLDPAQPIYREFAWIHDPWPSGCMFIPGYPPDFAAHMDFVQAAVKLRLGGNDPDQLYASDFYGPLAFFGHGANVFLARGTGFFNLFKIGLGGVWNPDTCGNKIQTVDGTLIPLGPVKCGWAPAPPGHCDFTESKDECSDAHKMAASKRFNGHLEGGSFSLKRVFDPLVKRLPWWAQDVAGHFLKPGGAVFRIKFGTRDSSVAPSLTRAFVFLAVGNQGGGTGIAEHFKAAVAPDQDAKAPSRLANEKPDNITAGSDLSTYLGKLVIHGASNKIELTTGAGTFNFFNLVSCNHGGTRTYYGTLLPAWRVNCPDDLDLPDVSEEECKDTEKCPESTRTAGHKVFTAKVGRATLANLPMGGRKLASRFGCRFTAAFVNVQSEDGPRETQIHREFLVIFHQNGCQFDVAKGNANIQSLFDDHQLAIKDPDDILAPSDFFPLAYMTSSGSVLLSSVPPNATPLILNLPGAFDPTCKSRTGSPGIAIPLSAVDCGAAPEPEHDSTHTRSHIDECNQYRKQHADFVNTFIDSIGDPDYQDIFARLSPGAAFTPPDEYSDYTRRLGQTISPAVFLALAPNPQGGQPIQVVAFADLQIVRVYRNGWMEVQFLSEPCAFDRAGNVVFIRSGFCVENFAHAGETAMLHPMQNLDPNTKLPPPVRHSVQKSSSTPAPAPTHSEAAPQIAAHDTSQSIRRCSCGGTCAACRQEAELRKK